MRYNCDVPARRPSRPAAAAEPPGPDDVDALTDAFLTASRLLVAVSARSIGAVDDSITVAQFRALVVLDTRGPVKLTTLAEYLAVTPSTASRMVDRLVLAGLAGREASPTSRRELIVSLTGQGAAVVRSVTERRRAEITRIVSRMPAPARRGLVRALKSFAEAGGEPPLDAGADVPWL